MPESSNTKTTAGDIEDQIKNIREDISRLTKLFMELCQDNLSEAKRAAREELDELQSRSRRAADEATARAKQTAGSVEGYISDKPVQSTMIALLVGIFIGFLTRR